MVEGIYKVADGNLEDVEHVAIAITLVEQVPGQQHVGVLHRDQSAGEIRMLHLAWHHDLRNSVPKPTYAWIVPQIPTRRARQVAAFCRRIQRANPAGIPYAFSSASDCFDEQSGAFLVGPGRNGLTCASFVLGVFHSTGLQLVRYETWPISRPGDEEWKRYVIDQLKATGASAEHIMAVESELGAVRFRPEDVAGAGATNALPASFQVVDPLAREIVKFLMDNRLFT